MKITKLKIINFRKVSNLEINFESNLNAIAGQNGTIKTTLLGLIGHIFNFNNNHKNLSGKNFATDFSDIFKFAYPDYDKAGSHEWITYFDNLKEIKALSYDRIEKGKLKTIRIRVGKSSKDKGKINFPVIYLGMGRLFPLNIETEIKSEISELTDQEKKYFQDVHNDILIIDEVIIPEAIRSTNKRFYAPATENYNHLGNSAGQDNIGQIITSILSFKRLQKELGDKYYGGILLIDEIDASLFPAAQIRLINYLNKISKELNLQIFFTTHSLEVLEKVNSFNDSKIIFLDKTYGKIDVIYDLDFDTIRNNLLVLGPEVFKVKKNKKYVYCEDDEAVDFLKNILSKERKEKLDIISTKLGEKVLKDLAKKKIPDFQKSVIVLDGDSSISNISNVISLPGSFGPDRLIYDFLKSLDKDNDFWKKRKGYNKQYCFKELSSLDTSLDKSKAREKLKRWYKTQKKYWGRNSNMVFKIWIKENEKEVKNFLDKFHKIINNA